MRCERGPGSEFGSGGLDVGAAVARTGERITCTSFHPSTVVMADPAPVDDPSFLARQHVMFALRSLKFLPTPYQEQDSSR